jgi:hypothetical protein
MKAGTMAVPLPKRMATGKIPAILVKGATADMTISVMAAVPSVPVRSPLSVTFCESDM